MFEFLSRFKHHPLQLKREKCFRAAQARVKIYAKKRIQRIHEHRNITIHNSPLNHRRGTATSKLSNKVQWWRTTPEEADEWRRRLRRLRHSLVSFSMLMLSHENSLHGIIWTWKQAQYTKTYLTRKSTCSSSPPPHTSLSHARASNNFPGIRQF